ncbi:3-methyladenine DNA glycosylase [Arthrobacter sp. zg-Y916]|uniref:DNA-3-methyladenine glycosylase family protein n=1 Tax=Arthrobacter sp. zg-Y916 TaxID=2894190 RepID=UPI001E6144E1|nr:3-methyladenine DNA glycosylase [Arthrobacter sp. zg-Y916]MCC9192565.1 3-methyladenine DNA glycosylase [Arthrobacter sp. zg-Y916]
MSSGTAAEIPAAAAGACGRARTSGASAGFEFSRPLDLAATLRIVAHGGGDPTVRLGGSSAWLSFRTASGPVTLLLVQSGGTLRPPARVSAQAWGPGAAEALQSVPALLGEFDHWTGFDDPAFMATLPPALQEARRRHPGLRLPSTGRIIESLVPVVLEQKVTQMEAYHAWRYLVQRFGRPAPGPAPAGLMTAPDAAGWRKVPSWDWHRAGVDSHRSRTILGACSAASGLERLAAQPLGPGVSAKLQSVPGIGPWSAAEILQRTHGSPDDVSVGDFHLAAYVGAALTGKRTDDAGMLALLEPWRGHRQRVVRLIGLTGFRKQAFGPRLSPQDHRRH